MKLSTFRNDLLKLIYNATAIANVADNAATAPLTNIQFALHTVYPGLAGDQTTSEVAYTGYARVAVARTSGGFTVTTNSVSPVAAITFGQMTAGAGGTVTHATSGVAASAASKVFDCFVLGSRLGPFSAVVAGNAFTIPVIPAQAVARVHSVHAGNQAQGVERRAVAAELDDGHGSGRNHHHHGEVGRILVCERTSTGADRNSIPHGEAIGRPRCHAYS